MRKEIFLAALCAAITIASCTHEQQDVDNDQDGIADLDEALLLQKFSPYYMFSNDGGDENFRPTDVYWYLSRSELLTSGSESSNPYTPNSVIKENPDTIVNPPHISNGSTLPDVGPAVSGDITVNQTIANNNYHINPLASIKGESEDNPGRHGNSWNTVLTDKNTGLYGHVVPLKLADPYRFAFEVASGADTGKTYYKIEFWQFFGYSSDNKPFDLGDHEGDWTTVQLLYDPEAKQIISVFHFAHGIGFRFDLKNAVSSSLVRSNDGLITTFKGINYNEDVDLVSHDLKFEQNPEEVNKAQNNVLSMFQPLGSNEFTHPVVYIEHGSHEFFPSQAWDFFAAPNHNGQGIHYLTANAANLGEVEHVLPVPAARAILRFNGYWGAYSRENTPPFGPPLHKCFTWPASSSVRWLLQGLL